MSQVIRHVGHWPGAARMVRDPRAAWQEILLRLGYGVAITALLVVVLTIGGSGRQQAGATGPEARTPGGEPPALAAMEPPAPRAPVTPANGQPPSAQDKGNPGAGTPAPSGQPPSGEQPAKDAGGTTPPGEGRPAPETQHRPLREVPGAGHRVALTFDDGPFPEWTPRYLAALAAIKTPATFFMVGRQAEAHPELVRAVLSGGHELGNHSWRHANLGKASRPEAEADLRRAAQTLEKISGEPVKYFRPPYGAIGPDLLAAAAEQGALTVTWNIDPRDWSNPGPKAIINNVMANVRDGSIILLHERHPGTLVALPLLVKELRDKGYELVTISELVAGSRGKNNNDTPAAKAP